MADPITIVRGNSNPQAQRTTFDFDPVRGYIVLTDWEGASINKMEALQQQYVANGVACRLTYVHDKALLECHDATLSYAIDTWQILGNELDIDVFSHPTVLQILANYTSPAFNATIIMAAILEGLQQSQSWDDVQFPDGQDLSGPDDAVMEQFYILYQKGTQNFQREQYVLRHTCNVSNRWTGTDNFTLLLQKNINKIYTPAQLNSEVTSSFWAYPLPQRMRTELANIPSIPATGLPPTGYLFGWKKGPPTEVTAANNRIDVQQDYSCELWSTYLYGIAT